MLHLLSRGDWIRTSDHTPPDAYSNVCISLKINAISSFIVPWLTFWLTFIVNNQEWLVMK